MAEQVSLKATVHGLVQGVSFRAYTLHRARNLGLTGSARNLPSGEVEVYAEGDKPKLEKLLEFLKKGPPLARVDRVETVWGDSSGKHLDFSIRR